MLLPRICCAPGGSQPGRAHPDTDPDSESHQHGHEYSYPAPECHSYTNSHPNRCSKRNTDGYTISNSHGDNHLSSNRHRNIYTYHQPHAAKPNPYGYSCPSDSDTCT